MTALTFERETWHGYVRRVVVGRTREEVAKAAGIHQSGVYRWINKADVSRPRAENVVQFARGMGESPVEALIAAGYLEPDEVEGTIQVVQKVDALTDEEFIDELAHRLRRGQNQMDELTAGLSGPDDLS